MKPASIHRVVVYRVEATVPDRAWELYHDSVEYQLAIGEATAGNVSAGSDSYSEAVEWAEFHTQAAAYECARRLNNAIRRFDEKAREYDEAARREELL